MKKSVICLVLVILFLGYFVYKLPSYNDVNCSYLKEFKNSNFDGFVVEKYIDSTQHSFPIIKIMNKDNSMVELNLIRDSSNSFFNFNVGDTVIKKSGEKGLYIKKNGVFVEKIIDFGCKP